MLWYLLFSEDYSVWEQRVGSFCRACPNCQKETWQLTFRMYRTKGTAFGHASSAGFALNECYQIRCSGCGYAVMAAHPSQWAGTLGVPFHQESFPAGHAVPGYVSLAFHQR